MVNSPCLFTDPELLWNWHFLHRGLCVLSASPWPAEVFTALLPSMSLVWLLMHGCLSSYLLLWLAGWGDECPHWAKQIGQSFKGHARACDRTTREATQRCHRWLWMWGDMTSSLGLLICVPLSLWNCFGVGQGPAPHSESAALITHAVNLTLSPAKSYCSTWHVSEHHRSVYDTGMIPGYG